MGHSSSQRQQPLQARGQEKAPAADSASNVVPPGLETEVAGDLSKAGGLENTDHQADTSRESQLALPGASGSNLQAADRGTGSPEELPSATTAAQVPTIESYVLLFDSCVYGLGEAVSRFTWLHLRSRPFWTVSHFPSFGHEFLGWNNLVYSGNNWRS